MALDGHFTGEREEGDKEVTAVSSFFLCLIPDVGTSGESEDYSSSSSSRRNTFLREMVILLSAIAYWAWTG